MKTLYVECKMGIAGDMLMGALYDLLSSEEQNTFLEAFRASGLCGAELRPEDSVKCGIRGTHMAVMIEQNGQLLDEGAMMERGHTHDFGPPHDHKHDHEHGHQHDHEHGHQHDHAHGHAHEPDHDHHHSTLKNVFDIIDGLNLSDRVKIMAKKTYTTIAEAEAKVHGTEPALVHFHEVGSKDAIADIVGSSMLLDMLLPDCIKVSPINLGSGTVRCAHGIMPVPAPATAEILKGVPSYESEIRGELCTPTGAALAKAMATDEVCGAGFGLMDAMSVERTGYGMGCKDFERPNCVRVLVGEAFETETEAEQDEADGSRKKATGSRKVTCTKGTGVTESADRAGTTTAARTEVDEGATERVESVLELSCNIDDMTGEELGFAMEMLFDAGALDVYFENIMMKKSRPGIKLVALIREEDKIRFLPLIFKHTTTLGIRIQRFERVRLTRRIEESQAGGTPLRRKVAEGFGVRREKPEYEDVRKIAINEGLAFRDAGKKYE